MTHTTAVWCAYSVYAILLGGDWLSTRLALISVQRRIRQGPRPHRPSRRAATAPANA